MGELVGKNNTGGVYYVKKEALLPFHGKYIIESEKIEVPKTFSCKQIKLGACSPARGHHSENISSSRLFRRYSTKNKNNSLLIEVLKKKNCQSRDRDRRTGVRTMLF